MSKKKLTVKEDKYGLGDLYDKAFANGMRTGKSDTIKRLQEWTEGEWTRQGAGSKACNVLDDINQFLKTL